MVLLGFSAVFAGSETALFMVRRDRQLWARERSDNGDESSVVQLLMDPSRLLMTVLLGNLLVNMSFFAFSTIFVLQLEEVAPGAGVIAGAGFLMAVIIFGEIVPKTLASVAPLGFSRTTAPFLLVVSTVLGPLTRALSSVINGINRLFGIPIEEAEGVQTEELVDLVDITASKGWLRGLQTEVIFGVMQLHEMKLREIMTPRVDVDSGHEEETVGQILERARERGFTLIPLHREHHDLIETFIDASGLIGHKDLDVPVGPYAEPLPVFPELASMDQVLKAFLDHRHRVALVVDEYGEMSGLVTWNDVMKCLRRRVAPAPTRREGSAILLLGRTLLKDVPPFEHLDPGDAVTLGGFISDGLDRIPRTGETICLEGVDMVVTKATPKAVDEVMVMVQEEGGKK